MIFQMGRIKVLAPETAAIIAAGEVVDRPVAIVKELVENALDAGADRINISIADGGISRIEISDNGHGISEDDLSLTIERHATSKISQADDLERLSTLGFRGEALASIAAVSRLEIISRQSADEHALRMTSEGGRICGQSFASRAPGTTVLVEDLFFNTPARKKFISSAAGESSRISSVIEKFILAYPHVAFTLSNNTKEMLRSYGTAELFDAAVCVLGNAMKNSLIRMQYATEAISITGLLSKPEAARKSRTKQFYFVNGRIISNKTISSALATAAKPFMISAMNPVAIMDIRLNPDMIDANIHPQKADVRFSDEPAVFNAVYRAVKTAFAQNSTGMQAYQPQPIYGEEYFPRKQNEFSAGTSRNYELDFVSEKSDAYGENVVKHDQPTLATAPNLIGSFLETYILVQDADDLILIDQHAFHERMIYERLKQQDAASLAEQMLLPEIVDLPSADMEALLSIREELAGIGLCVEHIGGRSIAVKSMPLVIADYGAEEIIKEIVDILNENDMNRGGLNVIERINKISDDVIKLIACKAAIKAGDVISEKEKRHIMDELFSGGIIPYCPHGRPIMVRMNKGTIEKMFSRKL